MKKKILEKFYRNKETDCHGVFDKMRKIYVIALFFVIFAAYGFAQTPTATKTVSGVVVDETGEPMPGVLVSLPEGKSITITGEQGNYAVVVPRTTDSLQFSFLGYQPLVISIREAMFVRMRVQPIAIEEVVVTGIYSRKVESYTGAANTIHASDIQRVSNQNVFQSLKNLAPALYMQDNLLMG
jgi:hypothetical protein